MQVRGGTDSYTNAISDIYQDNFDEGIFTGKGIYDLKKFHKILCEEIPENTVLSHDLLEGSYLRCGLVTDILLLDDVPSKYNSYSLRLSRWIRGDWQILNWIKTNIKIKNGSSKSNPLNLLSKFKILDNLRRSLIPIAVLVLLVLSAFLKLFTGIKVWGIISIALISYSFSSVLDVLSYIIFKKGKNSRFIYAHKSFSSNISLIKSSILRGILAISFLPHEAYISLTSIIKTIYRMKISKCNLLEWLTAEEAEKQAKSSLISYYKFMYMNLVFGVLSLIFGVFAKNTIGILFAVIWLAAPAVGWYISRDIKKQQVIEKISKNEKEYILEIGKRTWKYFEEYINEENNFLPPDNHQEGRKNEIAARTSSTNIGLGLLSIVSAYDLKYIELERAIDLLIKMINTIMKLQKWNGHLYNWYNTNTLEPLIPRYISTVDNGNFIGYLYTTKQFLINILKNNETNENLVGAHDCAREELRMKSEEYKICGANFDVGAGPVSAQQNLNQIQQMITNIDNIIQNTDFTVLYNYKKNLFSIGYDIEQNKLTNSYYDLLASEARQASLIAIAKKDVPVKHWNALSRTLTSLNKYKGLISWSGTAFEYLMPNINIKQYESSLLDESSRFLIMSQMEYAKKLRNTMGNIRSSI